MDSCKVKGVAKATSSLVGTSHGYSCTACLTSSVFSIYVIDRFVFMYYFILEDNSFFLSFN